MANGWTQQRRDAQRQRAHKLIEEGKVGGPGRGQGRKPRPSLDLSWSLVCPGCGRELHGGGHDQVQLDQERAGSRPTSSFVVMRDGTFVDLSKLDGEDLDIEGPTLKPVEPRSRFRKGQRVTVGDVHGELTGRTRDGRHVYVKFDEKMGGRAAGKFAVGEVRVSKGRKS